MRAFPILALLLGSATAHADGAWIGGVQAGVVDAHIDYADDYEDGASQWGAGLAFDISRRIHPKVALGVRMGIGPEVLRSEFEARSMFSLSWDIYYRPIVVGATVSYFPTARTWVSPWIGIEHDWVMRECTTETSNRPDRPDSFHCGDPSGTPRDNAFAYGIGGGIDLFAAGPHRAGLAALISRARGGEYTSFALSVSYRYW